MKYRMKSDLLYISNHIIRILVCVSLLIFVTPHVHSQINWEEYKEPNGQIQRLTIDPRITFSSTDNSFNVTNSFRSQFLTRYSLSIVKENHISNLFISNNLVYNKVSETSFRFESDFFFDYNYTFYINKRRGLFLRTQPTFSYDFRKRGGDDSSNENQLNSPVLVGFGRLENISTVYQAIRIERELYDNYNYDQDKVFNVARSLRSLDYNNALDTRMRTVENNTKYLELLDSYGYDVESFFDISNAIDAFRFERPNFIFQGYEISAGLLPRFSFGANEDSDIVALFNAVYAKALSDKWHWSVNGQLTYDFINYDLVDDFIVLSNTLSYLPTARTNIRFSQRYFRSDSFESFDFSVGVDYFVSPQLNLFLSSGFNITDTRVQNNLKSFSHDMGLKYFFF